MHKKGGPYRTLSEQIFYFYLFLLILKKAFSRYKKFVTFYSVAFSLVILEHLLLVTILQCPFSLVIHEHLLLVTILQCLFSLVIHEHLLLC